MSQVDELIRVSAIVPVRVAIDGQAGAGKSSLATGISEWTGWPWASSGSFYRAAVVEADRQGISLADGQGMIELVTNIKFELESGHVSMINGSPVTRSELAAVSKRVPDMSHIPEVRAQIRLRQHDFASVHCIIEGRDIGSVVFPDSPFKVVLTCDPDERARRRSEVENRVITPEDVRLRDQEDGKHGDGRMTAGDGAIHLDSTYTSTAQLVVAVEVLMFSQPELVQPLLEARRRQNAKMS